MTKLEMKNNAMALLTKHEANKELSEALTILFDEFIKSSKSSKVKIEKFVTINEIKYQWCHRHEIYEPVTNFTNEKKAECKIAYNYWSRLTKDIKLAENDLLNLIDNEEYNKLKEAKATINNLKDLRGGRYNFEDNSIEFNNVENYDYDVAKFVKLEDIK